MNFFQRRYGIRMGKGMPPLWKVLPALQIIAALLAVLALYTWTATTEEADTVEGHRNLVHFTYVQKVAP